MMAHLMLMKIQNSRSLQLMLHQLVWHPWRGLKDITKYFLIYSDIKSNCKTFSVTNVNYNQNY